MTKKLRTGHSERWESFLWFLYEDGYLHLLSVNRLEKNVRIAVAAVNGIEVVITWNFAHLNNPFTRKKVREIVEAEGYSCPEICSPKELLEVER